MISAGDFCETLRRRGYDFYTGVPCSYFQGPIALASQDPALRYVPAANEGAALAIAAGAALASTRPVVLLQNSGLGNLVNPLASLSLVYRIPALCFVSLRARPGGPEDEPQHRVMGGVTADLLELLGVPGRLLPDGADGFAELVDEADRAFRSGLPAAVLVPKGSIGGYPAATPAAAGRPLTRAEAVGCVAEQLRPEDVTVSTTGFISRELFAARDLPGNFYMQGSMGHAAAIALGIALQRPRRTVLVIDGDGAVLMHMGTLSTIGACAPPNLVHVTIDNEAYESTGGQATTSRGTRLEDVARACGYRSAVCCGSRAEVEAALRAARAEPGPSFVLVKVGPAAPGEPPRITTRHSPTDTTTLVRDHLR
jgi:phosphonopyruvate decarboxylase